VQRSFDDGVAIVAPSSQIDTSRRAVEYAERFDSPMLWAAVGLHPIHLDDVRTDESEVGQQQKFQTRQETFDRSRYEPLLASKKVVAVGEVGLDYWRKPKGAAKRAAYKQKQIDTLVAQMDMALDHRLPVILHCRVAHDDLLDIVRAHPLTRTLDPPGVTHSYTGDPTQLKTFLDLGYYVGINGIVFKLDLMERAAREAPLERILLETDAPYLTPPVPRQIRQQAEAAGSDPERNEPRFVKYVAERIAQLKGISVEEVERQTTENAQRVFGVDFT
jgi:TatD DNase family protein